MVSFIHRKQDMYYVYIYTLNSKTLALVYLQWYSPSWSVATIQVFIFIFIKFLWSSFEYFWTLNLNKFCFVYLFFVIVLKVFQDWNIKILWKVFDVINVYAKIIKVFRNDSIYMNKRSSLIVSFWHLSL